MPSSRYGASDLYPMNYNPYSQRPLKEEDKVDTTSIEYDSMAYRWPLLHDLLGGTESMRAAKSEWLPREPRETYTAYENRLRRSFLYNAYADTVEKLVAKPFSKPVSVQGSFDERIESIRNDVDRSGRDITQLGRDVFRDLVVYGIGHILVDFPKTEGVETLADERELGIRPNLLHVSPVDLISWRTERTPSGKTRLTQVRIREQRVEPKGDFIDELVHYIRVLTPDSYAVYRRKQMQDENNPEQDDYELVEEGSHSFGEIPLVSMYAARTGFLTAKPPLLDLAFMNLAHWQSLSDQRNVLRFARVGILFASGFTEEEMEEGLTIGPNQLIRSTNPEADIRYVEHAGQAIGAGQEDLNMLERRMEVLGLQPLVQRTGVQTATGKAIDESRVHTAVQSWIRSVESGLRDAYLFAHRWFQIDPPEDLEIDITNDFGVSLRATEDIESLLKLRAMGGVSQETFLRELKRRGLISEAVDIAEELEAVEMETTLPEDSFIREMNEPEKAEPEKTESVEELEERAEGEDDS